MILPMTKNGETRIVYCNALSSFVLKALADASPLRLSGDHLFGEVTGEQVSMAFKRVCRTLKIEDFRFTICATPPPAGCECRAPTSTPWRSCWGIKICAWRCGTSTFLQNICRKP